MMQVQYVTNEQGETTGVLLDVAFYNQLIGEKNLDPELLTDLSPAELQALATSQLATNKQSRLQTLLAQQKEKGLTDMEEEELDNLLFHIDQLTILKTRAKYTLSQSSN